MRAWSSERSSSSVRLSCSWGVGVGALDTSSRVGVRGEAIFLLMLILVLMVFFCCCLRHKVGFLFFSSLLFSFRSGEVLGPLKQQLSVV